MVSVGLDDMMLVSDRPEVGIAGVGNDGHSAVGGIFQTKYSPAMTLISEQGATNSRAATMSCCVVTFGAGGVQGESIRAGICPARDSNLNRGSCIDGGVRRCQRPGATRGRYAAEFPSAEFRSHHKVSFGTTTMRKDCRHLNLRIRFLPFSACMRHTVQAIYPPERGPTAPETVGCSEIVEVRRIR